MNYLLYFRSIRVKKILLPILTLILFFIFSNVAMYPIMKINGWPLEHDGLLLFERVGVFYQEMLKGNLFPLWTSYGQNGYGSGFPFLYHRFFNTFAASMAFFTGSILVAVKVTISMLLCFGAIGMFKLIREIGLSFRYSLCAGILFIFSNYVYTNWLVRGAVADFTSMVFIPWLYYYCIKLFHDNNNYAGIKIGFVMVCMFYSHIVIFYYALFTCAIFYSFFLFQGKKYLNIRNYYNVLWASGIFFLFCGMYAFGILLFKKIYNFSIMNVGTNHPINNFSFFEWYFIKKSYVWGETWKGLSQEIGRGFSLFTLFFMVVALILISLKKIKIKENESYSKVYKAFFVCLLFYFILQTPFTEAFYIYFPGADYLQFPWRLVSFLTVLILVALCLSIHLISLKKDSVILSGFAQFSLIFSTGYQVFFGVTIAINYENMSRGYIEYHLEPKVLLNAYQPHEYLPKSGILPPIAPALIEVKGNDCKIESIIPGNILKEVSDTNQILIHLNGKCKIYYNQFINPFTEISFSQGGIIKKSNMSTYILTSETSEKQIIKIKRIGLFKAIVNYIFKNKEIYS